MQITRGESLLWAPGRKYRACVKVTAAGKGLATPPTHSLHHSPQNVNRKPPSKCGASGPKEEGGQRPQLLCRLRKGSISLSKVWEDPSASVAVADLSIPLGQSRPGTSITIFHHGRRFPFLHHQTAREKWERWNHLSASHLCFGFTQRMLQSDISRNADIPSHISSGYQ